MKKCVIIGDWLMEISVGKQRYASQILAEIDKKIEEGVIKFEVEILVPSNINQFVLYRSIKVVRRGKITNKFDKAFWQQVVFPFYVKKNNAIGIDLTLEFPLHGCNVYAIFDCIPNRYPEDFADHRIFLKRLLLKQKEITRKKSLIITLTKDSKEGIQNYYSVPDENIVVTGCGWEHMSSIEPDWNIFDKIGISETDAFFFSLGSKYKHKNFSWILKAAKLNPKYYFVISGSDLFSTFSKELEVGQPTNVIFTGYLSDGEIKSLMLKARAFIQPSLYEGFGLPPLEALSLGKDIVVSNTSCFPEIYGDCAYYIDPYSEGCDLDDLLQKRVGKSDSCLNKYTWENAASCIIKLLYEIQERC